MLLMLLVLSKKCIFAEHCGRRLAATLAAYTITRAATEARRSAQLVLKKGNDSIPLKESCIEKGKKAAAGPKTIELDDLSGVLCGCVCFFTGV